jgi:hypothetical protein
MRQLAVAAGPLVVLSSLVLDMQAVPAVEQVAAIPQVVVAERADTRPLVERAVQIALMELLLLAEVAVAAAAQVVTVAVEVAVELGCLDWVQTAA